MMNRQFVFWAVDLQRDFMFSDGKLYVAGAEAIVPNVKRLVSAALGSGSLLVSSSCMHAENDPEFKVFPPHCVRGTTGAEIISEALAAESLRVPSDRPFQLPEDLSVFQQIVLEKQVLDVFSNPHATNLIDRIGKKAEYFVFGVVTEYCVYLAGKGLLERGRKVSVVRDAIETLNAEEGRRAIEQLAFQGAHLVTTNEATFAARNPRRILPRATESRD